MTVFIGVDPASATGAVGVLDSEGNYIESFMIEHQDKHIRAMVLKNAFYSEPHPPMKEAK